MRRIMKGSAVIFAAAGVVLTSLATWLLFSGTATGNPMMLSIVGVSYVTISLLLNARTMKKKD